MCVCEEKNSSQRKARLCLDLFEYDGSNTTWTSHFGGFEQIEDLFSLCAVWKQNSGQMWTLCQNKYYLVHCVDKGIEHRRISILIKKSVVILKVRQLAGCVVFDNILCFSD